MLTIEMKVTNASTWDIYGKNPPCTMNLNP